MRKLATKREALRSTEILALSVHYSDQLAREILDAGIHGYIVKSDSEGDLVAAVEVLARHKPFFTPRVWEVILKNRGSCGPSSLGGAESSSKQLTSREREIAHFH